MGSGWILEAIKGSSFRTKMSALKKILFEKSKVDDLTKCALCPNMCRFACPISIVDGKETTSPAGKSRIALLIKNNHIEAVEENILPLYYCLSCDACSIWCFFNFSVSELTRPLRSLSIKRGVYPGKLREVLENLRTYGCPYGELEKMVEGSSQGDTLYLQGCLIQKNYPTVTEKTLKLLKILGHEPFTIPNEICCGYLAYEAGDDDLFVEIATKNAEILNSQDVKVIITSCPECAYTYRVIYPKYKIKIKAEIYHISEVIKNHLDKLNFKEIRKKVTIHDPSKLAIGLNQPTIISEILSRIPRLEVRLPMRYGKNTFECGSDSLLLRWIDNNLLHKINIERFKELNEEAEIIITASYSCKKGLEEVGGRVYDIAEFVLEAIKID